MVSCRRERYDEPPAQPAREADWRPGEVDLAARARTPRHVGRARRLARADPLGTFARTLHDTFARVFFNPGEEHMDLFRVLGAAAFGAVLGASIAWIVDRHKAQVATSFTMHREYFDALVEVREAAARFIATHRDHGTLADLWKTEQAADMECVWRIVYFYERLWVAMKYRYIKRKLVPDLFGYAFNYWYEECFEAQLVGVDDPTARHIADLRQLLVKMVDQTEVDRWEKYRETWQLGSRSGPESP